MGEPKDGGANARTQFAMQAFGLAELFRFRFEGERLAAGDLGYTVELSAPDGPSTGGGAQALQHIKLVSPAGGPTIVAGSCNQVEKRGELRSFEYVAAQHARRFKGAMLLLDRVRYNELLNKLQAFFVERSLRVIMLDVTALPHAPEPPAVMRAPASPRTKLLLGALGLVFALAVCYLLITGRG
jgi:hypothetical protein